MEQKEFDFSKAKNDTIKKSYYKNLSTTTIIFYQNESYMPLEDTYKSYIELIL